MQTIHRQDNDQESIALGGRLLYLRTPQFQGEDVEDLQTALGALGFSCGGVDGTFGAYTEGALRKFQVNMGLVSDGIAGVKTYDTLKHLHGAWADKPTLETSSYMGFARAADVLEHHAVCLFGTGSFTRKIASYLSNLALATNPRSKMLSAETLLVVPDASMLLTHIVLEGEGMEEGVPRVSCGDAESLAVRVSGAIDVARKKAEEGAPLRIAVEVSVPDAAEDSPEFDKSAHHHAIALLDAFCVAFS